MRRVAYLLCQDWQRADERLVNVGRAAGPADDPTALGISVWPAGIPGSYGCNFVAGLSSYVTIDGAQAMLRIIDQPYKHEQYLCVQDVRGLQVYISLDGNVPGSNDTPLPDARRIGTALTVFSHLHLLGPDVADWTALQP